MPNNIVHVLSSFDVGGAERFALDLAQVQSNDGDQVAIYSCSPLKGALYEKLDCPNVVRILSSGHRWSDYCVLYKRLVSSKCSVLHVHSPGALRNLTPLFPLLKLRGVTIIYTRHGLAPLSGKKWRLIHRYANLFVSWVTFVSDAGKQVFYDNHGWAKSKLVTISNGVYVPDEVATSGFDVLRVGSVGRMVALKGQKDLIEAIGQLKDDVRQKVEVHFFGDGPERDNLERLAVRSLFEGQYVFHGMELDREKVYSAIDILAVCSEQEGLSLAIMEAMARERPVVATDVGDSSKLVLDEVTGLLFEYSDVNRLSEYLTLFFENSELRVKLGLQAREHMINHFSLEAANSEYQLCYQNKS